MFCTAALPADSWRGEREGRRGGGIEGGGGGGGRRGVGGVEDVERRSEAWGGGVRERKKAQMSLNNCWQY